MKAIICITPFAPIMPALHPAGNSEGSEELLKRNGLGQVYVIQATPGWKALCSEPLSLVAMLKARP